MDDSGASGVMVFVILALIWCSLAGIPLEDGIFLKGASALLMVPFHFFYSLAQMLPGVLGLLVYFIGFKILTFSSLNRLFGEETVALSLVATVALVAMTRGFDFL